MTPVPPPPALMFDGVVKRHGGTAVLNGIDLEIAAGAFVALVGESGSGKTTLLKTINRLVEPDAGRVMVDGRDNRDIALSTLRRGIGYAFQQTGLFPHLSVGDNVAMPLRIAGEPQGTWVPRVAKLLALVALPSDMAERSPSHLSGGQAQRVGLARALAAAPSVMLMDEPFGALDPATRAALGTRYRALHDRLTLTTMMVTHDMGEALLLADRVIVLAGGRIAADGSPAEIVARRGDPAVAALLDAPLAQAGRLAAL